METLPTDRSSEHLYVLRSEAAYGWQTAHLPDGRQVLVSSCSVFFSPAGDFLSCESRAPDVRIFEAPIRVRRFFLPERRIGIVDLPDTAREFASQDVTQTWSEEERREYPELIREWFEAGKYVFYCDGCDFYMSANGDVETS